jgi:hypothetical protein
MAANLSRSAADTPSADRRSIDDIDAEICALAQHMNAQTCRMLVLVREFDDRLGWAKWGLRNCAEWLAWRCGSSLSAAREKVRTAQALRALPAISAAFADGRLSYSKVRALTRVGQMHDEDSLLAYALCATAPQVEERCRQIRNVAPESSVGAWRAWERRSLALWRDEARGMMKISVEVPIEQGEVIAQALERAAETGDSCVGIEFTAVRQPSTEGVRDAADSPSANGWRAQQADALVAIAKGYLSGGQTGAKPAPAADHYQVVIHADASALHGGLGRSDLGLETVKRLTCDGSLITIVEDDEGTPLEVGRKRRTVTTALKRALWSRDRHCSFPGCHNRCYVDAHHIEHWADGGATSLENLTLLCTFHHTLLHEGGFKIRRDGEKAIYFQRPDGRVIPRFGYRPDDMRDDYAVGENPSMEVREPSAVYYLPACKGYGAMRSWCRASSVATTSSSVIPRTASSTSRW